MDNLDYLLYKSNMIGGQVSDNFVPTYELYGEESEQKPDFWLHCETLFSRSSLHNFEISLHRHESFFQLLYIEGGTGQVSFDGVIYPFQTPCAIMVPPGFNHGFAFSRDIVGHIVTILSPHMPLIGDGSEGRYGEVVDAASTHIDERSGQRESGVTFLSSAAITR
ncbi:hypothetical protein HED63_16380 [Ochrobactrum cytisi]|nr:hypothetical protein [Brucella cytisi]